MGVDDLSLQSYRHFRIVGMTGLLTKRARELRTAMTDAERALWHVLRDRQLGVRFRRQAPIGTYIVDFACLERKLVIEVDGGQHAESAADIERDTWLRERGFRVLRFWNHEVLTNNAGVAAVIFEALQGPPPRLPRASRGEGTGMHRGCSAVITVPPRPEGGGQVGVDERLSSIGSSAMRLNSVRPVGCGEETGAGIRTSILYRPGTSGWCARLTEEERCR